MVAVRGFYTEKRRGVASGDGGPNATIRTSSFPSLNAGGDTAARWRHRNWLVRMGGGERRGFVMVRARAGFGAGGQGFVGGVLAAFLVVLGHLIFEEIEHKEEDEADGTEGPDQTPGERTAGVREAEITGAALILGRIKILDRTAELFQDGAAPTFPILTLEEDHEIIAADVADKVDVRVAVLAQDRSGQLNHVIAFTVPVDIVKRLKVI